MNVWNQLMKIYAGCAMATCSLEHTCNVDLFRNTKISVLQNPKDDVNMSRFYHCKIKNINSKLKEVNLTFLRLCDDYKH